MPVKFQMALSKISFRIDIQLEIYIAGHYLFTILRLKMQQLLIYCVSHSWISTLITYRINSGLLLLSNSSQMIQFLFVASINWKKDVETIIPKLKPSIRNSIFFRYVSIVSSSSYKLTRECTKLYVCVTIRTNS